MPDFRAVVLVAAAAWSGADELAPPILYDMAPVSGPTRGGTIVSLSGAHLVPHAAAVPPVCRFGLGRLLARGSFRGIASHGVVTCSAPPADSGYEVAVELSLDGGASFTRSGFRFTYVRSRAARAAQSKFP